MANPGSGKKTDEKKKIESSPAPAKTAKSAAKKSKQIGMKVRVYEEILDKIQRQPDAKEFGVTYEVNRRLAESLELPQPAKPEQRKAEGGKKSGSVRKTLSKKSASKLRSK